MEQTAHTTGPVEPPAGPPVMEPPPFQQSTLPATETQIAASHMAPTAVLPTDPPVTGGTAGPVGTLPPTQRDTLHTHTQQAGGFGPLPSTAAMRPQPYPSPHPQSAWDVQ
eukprot:4236238-Amphidinium_carterae.1